MDQCMLRDGTVACVGSRVRHHGGHADDRGVVTAISTSGYVDIMCDNGQKMGAPSGRWIADEAPNSTGQEP